MLIPRHWKTARRELNFDGRTRIVTAVGWSNESPEAANEHARQRLALAADRIARGETSRAYGYGADRPLREAILEVIGPHDAPWAMVTRNAYGCTVLNTAGVMFVDLDFPQPGWWNWWGLKGSGALEEVLLARVFEFEAESPGAGFRVYRTAGGLRLLATDRFHDPLAPETDAAMARLQADPLYRQLCRRQECFRARLTPKPWRIGADRPPQRYVADEPSPEYQRWLESYQAAAEPFATCRYLTQIGSTAGPNEIHELVLLHDRATRVDRDLELA